MKSRWIIALLCGLGWATAGHARSSDCVDPVGGGQFVGGVLVLDWQSTMCLEHNDRLARMQRLAAMLPPEMRPTFSEMKVSKDRLPPVFARDVPLLRVVFPEQSFFDTAQSRLRPEAYAALQLIASSLRKEVPDVAVFVTGHTDDRGGAAYNYNLSVDRADAVAAELARIGVGEVALWRVGFGDAMPLRPNDSPEDMAVNRRVEFIFGARTEPVATWLQEEGGSLCSARDAADAALCKKPAPKRTFEAVALTRHYGIVAPPAVPHAVNPRLTRSGTTIAAPGERPVGIAMAAPGRLTLTLRPVGHAYDAPRPL